MSPYTKKLIREQGLKNALAIADSEIVVRTDTPLRFVSGLAVSGYERNSKGTCVLAGALRFSLPIALLWNHDTNVPLGKVVALETQNNGELYFRAQVLNSAHVRLARDNGNLAAAEQAWQALCVGAAHGVSIGWSDADQTPHGTLLSAQLEEISIVESGADRRARVQRVWEQDSVVRLNAAAGSSRRVIWSEGA